VLASIGDRGITEGELLSFDISATDDDGNTPVLTTSILPTGANFTDNLDGTGTFEWTPDYTQDGTFPVTFYATDGVFPSVVDSEVITITVAEAGNQEPELTYIGPKSTTENIQLTFVITATDYRLAQPLPII